MIIKQLSVFLENRSGTLQEVLKILKKENINILALSLADTSEFGLLRLIVEDPLPAKEAIKAAGYTSSVNEVISIELKNEAGYLSSLIGKISESGDNIEYMYAAPYFDGKVSMIIKTDNVRKDNNIIES
ncbi:MAG: ACT domain-containing protein [Lachnospiraceae bacterium]|nr:ACT domain-containing protein [Lachnospiraceae bacterium]